MRYPGGQFCVKSEEEMRSLFPYAKEALDNTRRIADRCHVEIEFGVCDSLTSMFPGYDSWTYLNKLCLTGWKKRYPVFLIKKTKMRTIQCHCRRPTGKTGI